MEKKKYGMLQLDADVHNALKQYCKSQGYIMSAFVNNLIKKAIKGK
jgi:predicted phosphatase